MLSTPLLFSITSPFPLPPAKEDLEQVPARVNQNSLPSSTLIFIHPRFCFPIEILFCVLQFVIPDSDYCMPGRNRDINHWAPQPFFTANLQIGVEFYSTEVTSPMWRFISFYGGHCELESPAADYSLDSFLCSHNIQQTLILFTDETLSCFVAIIVRKPGMERK